MTRIIKRALLRFVTSMAALVFFIGAVTAQELTGVDVARWQVIASRSEAAVDNSETTNQALEVLRGEIVTFRAQFDAARGINAARIASLREQLALLTPDATTSEGEAAPEAADIAFKRKDLEEQLAKLLVPVQVADSAFTRADGLINEIDTILRERQTDALFEVIESPLNPAHWPEAMDTLRAAISKLWVGFSPEEAEAQRQKLRGNAPIILFAVLAGLILIIRGRVWASMIVGRIRRAKARGLGIWRFVISLLRIGFPLIGLALLVYAARTTGYFGNRGGELLLIIPVLGGAMLGFRWVADQVFAREAEEALLDLSDKDRTQARFLVSCITLTLIIDLLLQRVVELNDDATLTLTVVSFPFKVLISFFLFRIGRLLRHFGTEVDENEDEDLTRASTLALLVRGLGTLTIVVAIAAPLLQAAGYFNASDFLLRPTVLTLVILGLVLALQRFAADIYGAITGQGVAARDALMPIFMGLGLLILAMPVLALIWGRGSRI